MDNTTSPIYLLWILIIHGQGITIQLSLSLMTDWLAHYVYDTALAKHKQMMMTIKMVHGQHSIMKIGGFCVLDIYLYHMSNVL